MGEVQDRLNAALSGRYAIEREIGAGGMATVYLAHDIKHDRKVALKMLRPELVAVMGAERFLTEIRTTANLKHPHILPLFDSGQADGFLFYVMPFIEGESLRQRLDHEKQLPVAEAVRIASAVAGALEHAHRQGVVHRDIKPANILVQDGEPVVSDFGIALAVGAAGAGRLTETGLSLGTPYYMSPEQATGDQQLGSQTDIYALGCVLYEMLVGEPPYLGNSAQAVLGKIIAGGPVAPAARRAAIAPNVDAAIRCALERLPADRFPTAHDFTRALTDPTFQYGNGRPAEASRSPVKAAFAAGLALMVGLAIGMSVSSALAGPERAVAWTFQVPLGEDQLLGGTGGGVPVALSADGARVVYASSSDGALSQLWQRSADDLEPVVIPGTEGAGNPVFSPDGSSIAFTAGGSIKTLSLTGGPPFVVVAEGVPNGGTGIDWGDDGMLYFSSAGSLNRVPASGGTPAQVGAADSVDYRWPDALPAADGLLVTLARGNDPNRSQIAVIPRAGGEPRVLLRGAMARYAPSGHLVYTLGDGTLMGVPFDLKQLEVTGAPVPLRQGITVGSGSASPLALSESGALAIGAGGSGGLLSVVRVTRTGTATELHPGWSDRFTSLALSPDGTRLAVVVPGDGREDVWVKQMDQGPLSKLTFLNAGNYWPSWTTGSDSVVFTSRRRNQADAGAGLGLWSSRADGTGAPTPFPGLDSLIHGGARGPGGWVVYQYHSGVGGTGDDDVMAIRPHQDSVAVPIANTTFHEGSPSISPDGRYVAYVSNETGVDQVYVRPFPNATTARWPVSTNGGTHPVWSKSGQELFYMTAALEMAVVSVKAQASFEAGAPETLFSAVDYYSVGDEPAYDVTADGQHLIMLRRVRGGGSDDLIVAQGFANELTARVRRSAP